MQGKLVWITGLAGSGKSTIAKNLYDSLKKAGKNFVYLDGDIIREILGNDLGHSLKDRLSNAKRIANLSKFLTDSGINVICATMSLFNEIHSFNAKNIKAYYEIFIDCAKDELIRRDQKKIYSRALRGEMKNVVGIDLPYDKPKNPKLLIDNTKQDKLEEKVFKILDLINKD